MATEGAPVVPDRTPLAAPGVGLDTGTDAETDADLATYVRTQQRKADRLLTYRESRRWELPRAARRELGVLGSALSRDTADPEFRKNLRIFRRLVGEAAELASRAERAMATDTGRPDRQRWAAIQERAEELREAVTLPTDSPLTLKTLLARRFELEGLLIELGDERYLGGRLAELYDETGTHSTWRELYGSRRPELLPGEVGTVASAPATGEAWAAEVEVTRARLDRLLRVKQAEDEVFRARLELKRRAAVLVSWVLAIVTLLFVVAVAWAVDDDRLLLAAVAAGATGAALGGLFRLRDQVSLGAQVRQFSPFFLGQVVVGATAGLVTYLVDRWGVIEVGGDGIGVAALAFAVGFSEAALVGLLAKLAGRVSAREETSAP